MAFSLIHSGALPAAGRSQMSLPKPAGLDHFRGRQQDPAVVHTGAQVQNRRNTHGLTDFRQAGTAVNRRAFRRQQSFHGAGNAVASGGQDDNVIFDQFFDNLDMAFVMRVLALLQPTTPAIPRIRPLMILSFRV